MVGMFQIVIYTIEIYLIHKGIEIFQIAFVSNSEHRKLGMIIGAIMVGGAVFIAVIFAVLAEMQANSIQSGMQNILK